jgi:hypothetical protein
VNVEELVRDSLREQATEQHRLEPGFADRVLTARRRRRTRTLACAAAATAAVVAVAVGVPLLDGDDQVRTASEMNHSDIIAHPEQSPPRGLIAAGDTALAAFFVRDNVKQPNGDVISTRVYGLLDQKTGKYRKTTRWAFLDVAPGMRTAAVLESELPAKRIGLLNLITGKVDRWIPVDHGVGGIAFSPDGKKLVATTYAKNPDRSFADHPQNVNGKEQPGPVPSRNGFAIVDLESGSSEWHSVPLVQDEFGWMGNSRQDFEWSHDGKLVYADTPMEPYREYYDLDGQKADRPANEQHLSYVEAGLSPDGKLAAGQFAGDGDEISSEIIDPLTGKRITTVPGQQLLAWVDNKRLIAWGCDPKKCSGTGEFRNQLLLLTIGSEKVVPLSGFRKASADYPGRWVPLFAER